jgi:hypothetical protein
MNPHQVRSQALRPKAAPPDRAPRRTAPPAHGARRRSAARRGTTLSGEPRALGPAQHQLSRPRRSAATAAQGPVQQDADGALRAAQDRRDLGRGHLVHETQDDARRRSSGSRATASHAALPASRARRLRLRRPARTVPGRLPAAPRDGAGRAAFVGDDVAGDLEEPDAERRCVLGGVLVLDFHGGTRVGDESPTRSSKRGSPASACMKTRSVASSAAWWSRSS